MAVNDLVYSSFQVGSNGFDQAPTDAVNHFTAEFPTATYRVVGSKLVGSTGSGGSAAARVIVFAIQIA